MLGTHDADEGLRDRRRPDGTLRRTPTQNLAAGDERAVTATARTLFLGYRKEYLFQVALDDQFSNTHKPHTLHPPINASSSLLGSKELKKPFERFRLPLPRGDHRRDGGGCEEQRHRQQSRDEKRRGQLPADVKCEKQKNWEQNAEDHHGPLE